MRVRRSGFRRGRTGAALAVTAVVTVLVAGCGGTEGGILVNQVNPIDLSGQSYTVGGKNSPEHQVLCEMAVAALESVGADVEQRCDLGDAQANRDALTSGEIDLYWENTGTAWTSFFEEQPVAGPSPQYRAVEKQDLEQNKIVWLEATWFNPTDAFAVAKVQLDQRGLKTLSDMAEHFRSGQPGNLCISPEYQSAELPRLQQTYDFQVPPDRLKVLPAEDIYQATGEAQNCLFGEVTGGDHRLVQHELVTLQDDKDVHLPYNAAVTLRQESYEQAPDIARVFAPIAHRLTNSVMAELTLRMAVEEKSAEEVAREWLQRMAFIGS